MFMFGKNKNQPTQDDLAYVQRCIKSPTSANEMAVKNYVEMQIIMFSSRTNEFGPTNEVDYLIKYLDQIEKLYPDPKQRNRIITVCNDIATSKNLNYPTAKIKQDTSASWAILIFIIVMLYLVSK